MDKILQREKISYKINIISNLIKDLAEYNNIEGYNNQKKFSIKIENDINPCNKNYYYNIKVIRGLTNPQSIFNMRFIHEENINDILTNLIKNTIESNMFSYTTYSLGSNGLPEKYNIFLKNDVVVTIDIKDKELYKITKDIEKQLLKTIKLEITEEIDTDKDKLQKEKAIKIFNLFKNIFNILEYYNSIENYNNKKEYKLKIENYLDDSKKCFIYNFSILRGIKEEVIFELRISIKDNKIMYDLIYDLILEYTLKETFQYDIITSSSLNNSYMILLDNGISVEFNFSTEKEKEFYNQFYILNKCTNNKTQIFEKTLKNN